MKKIFWFAVVLTFVLTGCAAVQAGAMGGDGLSLTEVQMYVIGVFASALVYVLKLIGENFPKFTIKREWLTALLYVVSGGLALMWSGFVLPAFAAFSDPITFVSALLGWVSAVLVALGPAVGFATLIYNVFLKKILDGAAAKFLPKA